MSPATPVIKTVFLVSDMNSLFNLSQKGGICPPLRFYSFIYNLQQQTSSSIYDLHGHKSSSVPAYLLRQGQCPSHLESPFKMPFTTLSSGFKIQPGFLNIFHLRFSIGINSNFLFHLSRSRPFIYSGKVSNNPIPIPNFL